MNIKPNLFSAAKLVVLFFLLTALGCSNEFDKVFKEHMKQGDEYISTGMYKQAADMFLAAAQVENTTDANWKFEDAIEKLFSTYSSMSPADSDEVASRFNDWALSAPTKLLEELLFITTKCPAATGNRDHVVAILRERYKAKNWEERLILEIEITGLPVRDIETSSFTVPSKSRSVKPLKMKSLTIWLEWNYGRPSKEQTESVIEVLRKASLPDVDSVLFGISGMDCDVHVVKICDVR